MKATDRLITTAEIHSVTPRAQGTDPSMPEALALQEEEALFRVWLGMDFYAEMIAALVDYSAVSSFLENTAYSIDDVREFNGQYFKCIQDTTGAEFPNNSAFWEMAPKFSNTNLEFLWNRYLKTVISWTIYHSGVIYEAIRVTQLGVQRYGENESFKNRPASARELSAFKQEIGVDVNRYLQNMHRYLIDNAASFSNYRPIKNNSLKRSIGNPRKYYGFSTW
jgi:hypothetical protein